MDESGNRYIIGKPAEAKSMPSSSIETLSDELSDEERHKRRMQIIEAFGTVDFDPDYDYKAVRRLDDKRTPKDWDE